MFKCEKYTLIIILQIPSFRLSDTQKYGVVMGVGM